MLIIYKKILYLFSFFYVVLVLHAFNLIEIPNELTFLESIRQSPGLRVLGDILRWYTPA